MNKIWKNKLHYRIIWKSLNNIVLPMLNLSKKELINLNKHKLLSKELDYL